MSNSTIKSHLLVKRRPDVRFAQRERRAARDQCPDPHDANDLTTGHFSIHELPDEVLVSAQLGDRAACARILRHCHPALQQYLWQMTHQELGDEVTQDLCQETFARFFLTLRSAADPTHRPLGTWLFEIARSVAVRHLQQTLATNRSDDFASPPGAQVSQGADLWVALADAMDELSPAHREILFLRQEQGLSYRAIAKALDICVGTVKSRLNRSRSALLEGIEDHLYRVPA